MPLNIIILDENPVDANWLLGCLAVTKEPWQVHIFTKVNDLALALATMSKDVFLVNEKLEQEFLLMREGYADINIASVPYVLIAEEGSAELYNKNSDAMDALAKPFITPHLLAQAIRYAKRNSVAQQQLRQLAHYDQLTKAANRHLFLDRLAQAIKMSKRGRERYGLIAIDLDDFKPINDNYGHDAGDQALKTFSNRVRTVLRETDTFARLGGDEFAALLPSVSAQHDLEVLANKILQKLQVKIAWKKQTLQLKASLGLMLLPDPAIKMNPRNVMAKVDDALVRAKRKGKNTYEWCL